MTSWIAFAVTSQTCVHRSRLVYRHHEYSFGVEEPTPYSCGASVAINDVEMHLDNLNSVQYVDGYCPRPPSGWTPTHRSPPMYSSGGLTVTTPANIPRGVGVRLNDMEDAWSVYENPDGWVCVGDPAARGDHAIEFAPNSVAVLQGTTLLALWLKPSGL